jgi:hypothetical protein
MSMCLKVLDKSIETFATHAGLTATSTSSKTFWHLRVKYSFHLKKQLSHRTKSPGGKKMLKCDHYQVHLHIKYSRKNQTPRSNITSLSLRGMPVPLSCSIEQDTYPRRNLQTAEVLSRAAKNNEIYEKRLNFVESPIRSEGSG